jgi:hypothetical protein
MKPFKLLIFIPLFISLFFNSFCQEAKKIITVNTNQAKLTESIETDSKVLKLFNRGDKLELIEIRLPSGGNTSTRFRAKFGEIEGFISSYFIDSNLEIENMTMSLKEFELEELRKKKENEKLINDSLARIKAIESKEMIDRLRINEEEEIRKNDSIADVMLRNAKTQGKISYQNNLKTRREKYYPKYGKEIGEKIALEKIWIGMTEEMLLDSWGNPEDINQTVNRYSNRKQYVYGLGQYVYVENGKVEAWQN